MTYAELTRQELVHLLMNAGSPDLSLTFQREITHDLLDKLGFTMIQREYETSRHDVQVCPSDFTHVAKMKKAEDDLQFKLMMESRDFWKQKYLETERERLSK
jgi:hypothetical protein